MAKKIAILNFKGGVGKTTTAINLGAALAKSKKKVLLIDLDGQCNTSMTLNYNVGDGETIYDALADKDENTEIPVYEYQKNMDFVPASIQLGEIEVEIANRERKEEILKRLVAPIEQAYDFIIIDCPPSEGILNKNAMALVEEVIIPVNGEPYALQGIANMQKRIERIKKIINPNLNIMGYLFTQYDMRLGIHKQLLRDMKDAFAGQIFNTKIKTCTKLKEAPTERQTIFDYAPTCTGAEDYLQFAKEVLSIYKKKG
ncbi:MAG: ParA family protein [Prevotellaceae bacterium]|nr:ParA family protein [Candidatus Minthosoma caballi]